MLLKNYLEKNTELLEVKVLSARTNELIFNKRLVIKEVFDIIQDLHLDYVQNRKEYKPTSAGYLK